MSFLDSLFGQNEKTQNNGYRKLREELRSFAREWKKVHKDLDQSLEEAGSQRDAMQKALTKVGEDVGEAKSALSSQGEALQKSLGKLSEKVGIHDMALENFLDEWEEIREREEEMAARLERMTGQLDIEKYHHLMESQEHLLSLVNAYQDQLANLRRLVAGKEDWEHQIDLMDGKLSEDRKRAQVEFIGEAGEKVDFARHEVLNVVDTPKAELEGTVIEVYSPGCLYAGAVWRKARVSAYRYVPA